MEQIIRFCSKNKTEVDTTVAFADDLEIIVDTNDFEQVNLNANKSLDPIVS